VIPVVAGADGHALTEQYEALREEVVAREGCRSVARGLALLMRKGMAAWMKGIEEEPSPLVAGPAPAASAVRLPDGFEQSLIDIVTEMALATTTVTAAAGGVT
jgi:hypothetical protein